MIEAHYHSEDSEPDELTLQYEMAMARLEAAEAARFRSALDTSSTDSDSDPFPTDYDAATTDGDDTDEESADEGDLDGEDSSDDTERD